MPIDRAATLRNAEKLLRQGKLDPAIAEYLRIVEAQPRDWNSANVLGDLYARAGRADKAVEQFVRIADGLNDEGFLPKAAALYKKILKLAPDHEHALLQCAEIAASQGLLTDARALFAAVEEKRRVRGDARGAAQARIRLGTLDPADYGARRSAAAARIEIGDAEGAARDLKEIAADLTAQRRHAEAIAALSDAVQLAPDDQSIRAQLFDLFAAGEDFVRARACATTVEQLKALAGMLESRGRPDDALEVLCDAAHVNPDDLEMRAHLARQFLARGKVDEAGRYLTVDVAGTDTTLLLTVAEIDLRSGRTEQATAITERLLADDPAMRERIAALSCAVAEQNPDGGAALADCIARAAIAQNDWQAAAGALETFAARAPNHIPSLQRLVEVCVDGGLEASILGAQAQLADAYLGAGMASEAKFIAEDLVAREPEQKAHVERLRRALVLLGEPDPDRVIADRLSAPSPLGVESLGDGLPSVEPPVAPAEATGHTIDIETLLKELDTPPAAPSTARARSASVEVDLSIVLDDLKRHAAPAARPAPAAPAPIAATDLDDVFEQLRGEASRRALVDAAEKSYQQALELQAAGDIDQCIEALQTASRAPKLRFVTASRLGRIYRDRGLMAHAVDWMERAAQAPAPAPADYHELLFDLAQALEATGEVARALAVCLELQADAGSYRDVDARVDRLAKAQARG